MASNESETGRPSRKGKASLRATEADGVLVYRAEWLVDICSCPFFLCGHDRGRINLGIFSIVLKIELYNKTHGSLV